MSDNKLTDEEISQFLISTNSKEKKGLSGRFPIIYCMMSSLLTANGDDPLVKVGLTSASLNKRQKTLKKSNIGLANINLNLSQNFILAKRNEDGRLVHLDTVVSEELTKSFEFIIHKTLSEYSFGLPESYSMEGPTEYFKGLDGIGKVVEGLVQELCEERGLCYGVKSFNEIEKLTSSGKTELGRTAKIEDFADPSLSVIGQAERKRREDAGKNEISENPSFYLYLSANGDKIIKSAKELELKLLAEIPKVEFNKRSLNNNIQSELSKHSDDELSSDLTQRALYFLKLNENLRRGEQDYAALEKNLLSKGAFKKETLTIQNKFNNDPLNPLYSELNKLLKSLEGRSKVNGGDTPEKIWDAWKEGLSSDNLAHFEKLESFEGVFKKANLKQASKLKSIIKKLKALSDVRENENRRIAILSLPAAEDGAPGEQILIDSDKIKQDLAMIGQYYNLSADYFKDSSNLTILNKKTTQQIKNSQLYADFAWSAASNQKDDVSFQIMNASKTASKNQTDLELNYIMTSNYKGRSFINEISDLCKIQGFDLSADIEENLKIEQKDIDNLVLKQTPAEGRMNFEVACIFYEDKDGKEKVNLCLAPKGRHLEAISAFCEKNNIPEDKLSQEKTTIYGFPSKGMAEVFLGRIYNSVGANEALKKYIKSVNEEKQESKNNLKGKHYISEIYIGGHDYSINKESLDMEPVFIKMSKRKSLFAGAGISLHEIETNSFNLEFARDFETRRIKKAKDVSYPSIFSKIYLSQKETDDSCITLANQASSEFQVDDLKLTINFSKKVNYKDVNQNSKNHIGTPARTENTAQNTLKVNSNKLSLILMLCLEASSQSTDTNYKMSQKELEDGLKRYGCSQSYALSNLMKNMSIKIEMLGEDAKTIPFEIKSNDKGEIIIANTNQSGILEEMDKWPKINNGRLLAKINDPVINDNAFHKAVASGNNKEISEIKTDSEKFLGALKNNKPLEYIKRYSLMQTGGYRALMSDFSDRAKDPKGEVAQKDYTETIRALANEVINRKNPAEKGVIKDLVTSLNSKPPKILNIVKILKLGDIFESKSDGLYTTKDAAEERSREFRMVKKAEELGFFNSEPGESGYELKDDSGKTAFNSKDKGEILRYLVENKYDAGEGLTGFAHVDNKEVLFIGEQAQKRRNENLAPIQDVAEERSRKPEGENLLKNQEITEKNLFSIAGKRNIEAMLEALNENENVKISDEVFIEEMNNILDRKGMELIAKKVIPQVKQLEEYFEGVDLGTKEIWQMAVCKVLNVSIKRSEKDINRLLQITDDQRNMASPKYDDNKTIESLINAEEKLGNKSEFLLVKVDDKLKPENPPESPVFFEDQKALLDHLDKESINPRDGNSKGFNDSEGKNYLIIDTREFKRGLREKLEISQSPKNTRSR